MVRILSRILALTMCLLAPMALAAKGTMTIANDWYSGFQAEVTITNDGATTLSNWTAEFTMPVSMGSIWNAKVQSSVGGRFVVSSVGWNDNIAPGSSVSFGFTATPGGLTPVAVTVGGNGAATSSSLTSSSPISSSPMTSSSAMYSSSKSSSLMLSSSPQSSSLNSSAVSSASISSAPTERTEALIEENATGFCNVDGSIDSNNGGFTGSGFINTDNTAGSGADWGVTVRADENYLLEWRYSNASSENRAGRVLINGVQVANVDFPSTGAWNSWTIATANIPLKAGQNTIRLEANSSAGLGNIDSLKVIGNNPQPIDCREATNSSSASSISSSSSSSVSTGNDGNYYVALDGSDSNPGTIARPFATLQKAIEVAGPGQLVYVRGGVYRIVNPAIRSAGVNFWKSGTSDRNRIRYFAFPGERPVLDFANLRIQPDPNYTSGVYVSGAYLHIKGFEIRNVPMNTRSNIGVSVGGGAHHDIFELLDIHHIAGSGMFINTTTGGHLILNSDSHDNYDPRSHQGDGQNADGFGVHYQKSGEPTVFRGCRAWWNSDDGWDFISQEVPVIVENSWGIANGYINSGTARPASGNGAGFKIGSSKTGIRHVIRNNLAWGNRNQGFYANHSSGGNDWFNNTSYNNGVQFDMLASSWDSNDNRTDGVILTGNKVHRMRNNIGFPNKNRNMQGVDSRFNTWDFGITPLSGDFLSVSDAGTKGSRNADGSLPTLDFLKLRSGSQMIDKGTTVNLPYSGSSPDLGAYER